MAQARIGRVHLKGGAQLHVLKRETPDAGGKENWRGEIVDHARRIAAMSEPGSELTGFMVVGVFSNGLNSFGFRLSPACPIPVTLWPAWISEIVRKRVVMGDEAEEVFNEMFERT